MEELKQKVVAVSSKVARYHGKIDHFGQNRLFQNKQR